MAHLERVVGFLVRATLAWVMLTAPTTVAHAQSGPATRKVQITGDRLGGLVLPIEPMQSELAINGERCWKWVVDDTQRLYLDGSVTINLGSYAFSASEAVIWINRLPSDRGLVNQVAIWFPSVSEPTRRAGLGASGRDVLVTASLIGKVRLGTVILEQEPPRNLSTVRRGEQRLARYLRRLVTQPLPPLGTRTDVEIPPPPPPPVLVPGGNLGAPAAPETSPAPATMDIPVRGTSALPIFAPEGMISFSGDEVTVDETEDAITVVGQVQIDYDSDGANDRFERISMAAQRAVVFLKPGTVGNLREGAARVTAESIVGIYLEGGVRATDGEYTLRGSSIYYDLASNRALVLDAILRTYTRTGRQLPIYARASEMRQLSADEWTAKKATVSTSEFFEPHISIGMNRVTITERPDAEGGRTTWVQGDGLTFRAQGIPFFFWPGFEGEAETSPLKSVRTGWQRDKGVVIGTTWDVFGLMGIASPDWGSGNLRVDGFTERGPALGLDLNLTGLGGLPGSGAIDAYGLYDFGGTDRTSGGENVEVGSGVRGQVVGEYQANLSVDLLIQAQLAYLSDQTWAAAWREDDYNARREYESSLYMAYSPDNTLLSGGVRGNINNFLSNSWKIASQPYFVEKVPEIEYNRIGDDFFKLLTWSSDYSFSRMAIKPTAGSADSLGVKPSNFALGNSGSAEQVRTLYQDAGYNDKDVMRFHTRQELAMPFKGESWNITPFVFGRFTYYLDGEWNRYRELQGINPDQDNYRYMLGGGARASTRFERVHNDASSDLFDINRIRHIVEPNMTLFYGWDSAPNGSYPVYDQSIEGATGGTAAQVGLRQVFQTQRGGPGNWTSVDFLEVDFGAVFNDSANDFQRTDVAYPAGIAPPNTYNPYAWVQSPYPQFFRYQPELSQWGTHGYASVAWELSSTFTIAGTGLFTWNERQVVDYTTGIQQTRTMSGLIRGSIGAQMTHNPDTRTYIEYRYLGASDDELLQAGVMYRVGRKYELTISPQYDLVRNEFRAFGGSLRRTFPDFDMNLNISYGLITDETTVGLSLSIPRQPGQGLPTY